MSRSMHGMNVVLGAAAVPGDVGVDINAANAAVRGTKPMSAAQGHKFATLGIAMLNAANAGDTGHPGATAKRTDLVRQLTNIDQSITTAGFDVIPETAAEILRNVVLQAVVEFNAVAEGQKTMAEAREQFFQDLKDNAGGLVDAAASAGSDIKTGLYVVGGIVALGVVGYLINSLRRR